MLPNEYILYPSDTSLTVVGVKYEQSRGRYIPLSKYKVLNIHWEEVYYPYPHSVKRIEIKKGAGRVYNGYFDNVEAILSALN